MSVDDDQRDRLRRAKLAALARDAVGLMGDPVTAGPVTGLVARDQDAAAVVLVERGDAAALAAALVWAERNGGTRLVLLADSGAEVLTRLAARFSLGAHDVEVRAVDGATVARVEPAPLPAIASAPEATDDLVAELEQAGVEVVVEHGIVRGEVRGLEVARLVEWPVEVGGDGELHLEVGIGRFDRDATAAARPDESPAVTLRRAVELVRTHRRPGAEGHPIGRLSRERWLRRTVLDDPGLVGAAVLRPVETTVEPGGLKDTHPAAAVGTDADGGAVVVVCSTGVDLSLVPLASDTRELHAPGARLVLAVPERDHHAATRTLVSLLREPGELVGVVPEWG